MDHITWTDVVLHDWTDYSGEFGHRASHVRRVRLTPIRSGRYTLDGLIRVDAYGPEEDWTEYDWETFDCHRPKGA